MTETTTAPAPPAAGAAAVDVRIEDDATPIVRLIGRTLRDSVGTEHAVDALSNAHGVVAIRSHDTPQAATLSIGADGIDVASGVPAEPDVTLVVDLNQRFSTAAEPEGDAELAAAVLAGLTPPVPAWREAAQHFWTVTRSLPGMPEMLIAVTEGPDGIEQEVLGEGPSQYLIASDPETLAGIFSGADDLIAALFTGAVGLQGTMSQLSVMVGASWKVRYDV